MSHTQTQPVSKSPLTRQRLAELRVQCQREPESVELHREAVAELLDAGLPREALPLLRRLAALCPDDNTVGNQLALALIECGDYKAALDQCRRMADRLPDDADAWHNLGVAACHTGDHQLAGEAFEHKLRLRPQSYETHNDLAVLYSLTGRPDQSAQAYLRCLEINPRYEKARENAFQFFWDQGRVEDGLKLADRLLESVGADHQITEWRTRFAHPETPGREIVTVGTDGGPVTRVRNKKLAFVASSDTFLQPIVSHFGQHNEVRIFDGQSQEELAALLRWADLTWFEWCDHLAIHGSRLPKTGKWVCRLHSYEVFSDAPAQVNWANIDRLILVNQSVGDILDRFWKVPVRRSVIHNGVDPKRFPLARRTKHGKKIASVGYINYKKNPSLLLQTFKAIHDWDPEFELHIAGEHQDPRIQVYFDELLPRLNLPITFHGWCDDMPGFYAGMDYVISTSLFESFHYSIAEGMLSGCLPLVHGWKGADGLYPESCLFDTPAQAIARIESYRKKDPDDLAAGNRQYIIDRYRWDDRLKDIDRVLDEVLHSTASGRPRPKRKPRSAGTYAPCEADHGLVSIVIPLADDTDDVEETIRSALDQTYQNREVIVCDDGSVDDTQDRLSVFGDQITVVRQTRRGLAAALNTAMQRARGTFIAPLLDSDVFYPDKLEKQLAALAANPDAGIVTCGVDRAGMEEEQESPTDNVIPSSAVLFRRELLDRTGWLDELDPRSGSGHTALARLWQRMTAMSPVQAVEEPLAGICVAAPDPAAPDHLSADDNDRWMQTVRVLSDRSFSVPAADATSNMDKDGAEIVFVGAQDPGGQMAMWAELLNAHTPHHARVLTHSETKGLPSDLVIKRAEHATQGGGKKRSAMAVLEEAEAVARNADLVIFAAGLAPGCLRGDARLSDTDEQPFGMIHWPDVLGKKRCAALLFGSPAVRGSLGWYREHLKSKGWPVLTCEPDIHYWLPESRFVPRTIVRTNGRYGSAQASPDRVAVIHPGERQPHEGKIMFRDVAGVVKERCPVVTFGRYLDMPWSRVLELKRGAQIGFDRIAVGTGHFGIDSLENSAIGLVNIVYLSPYTRALLAETLGTTEMPWESPATAAELTALLTRLATHPDELAEAMTRTKTWFDTHWNERRMIQTVAAVLAQL